MAQHLPVLSIAMLFFGAAVAFVVTARTARALTVAVATSVVVLSVWLSATVWHAGAIRYSIGGWGAPLGIDLYIDGLSVVMITLTAVVGWAVTLYAASYFGADDDYHYYWPLWLFLMGSLMALFSSNDAFNLYVCLELVTVSAVALVMVSSSSGALRAAIRYMLAAVTGSLFYLFGVAMMYGTLGAVDLGALADVDSASGFSVSIALIMTGLMIKTALVPVHFWLPPAHASAASPVSAALSALVIKGSFFIALRFAVALSGTHVMGGISILAGVLGATAIVWGSVQAFLQGRLKLLVAYSTVAQIGYLFILFPLVEADPAVAGTAVSAGIFHAVSHGLAKSAMFLVAGAILAEQGHDRIADLAGLARHRPAQAFAFGLAGVSMLGLPPSGGFVSKWLYVQAALQSGAWWWAIPVLAGGLFAAVYVFKVIGVFMGKPSPDGMGEIEGQGSAPSLLLTAVPVSLAVASLLVGVLGQPILILVGRSMATL